MYAKLGEEFLVLLPEIIPFLAELMEGRSNRKEGGEMGCEGGYGRGPLKCCHYCLPLPTDESVEIEQQTQAVIRVIEGVMGESIQQYF